MHFQCIETLLALPEFRVTGQVIRPHEGELPLERRDAYLVCPHCPGCCSRVKEGRARCLRDLPIFDRPVTLWLPLRRFQCPACPHRPWEKSATFDDRVKWTERLYHQVRQAILQGCPGQELARRYGFSARTVFRWTFAKSRGARPRKLGRAWGIEAYSRRKGHHDNTILVDLDKGRPITTLTGRRVEDVGKWFTSRPQEELDRVEVGGWDMSKSFFSAIQEVLGDQGQVIDRFHVVTQAVDTLDKGVRSVQKQLGAEAAQELKKLRKRWLKLPNQLDVDELIARADWRRRFPQLREVIDWVQDLRKWFERK